MFQSDGTLLSIDSTGAVIRWNTKGEVVQRRHFLWRHVPRASLSQAGRIAAIFNIKGIGDGVGIVDLSTNQVLRTFSEDDLTNVRMALSPDTTTFVVGRANSLVFHDLTEWKPVEVRTSLPVTGDLVFSPDSRRLALVNRIRTQIWSVPDRKPLCTLGTIVCAGPLAFSLDGKQVAIASGENVITLADAEGGAKQSEIKLDARVVHALAYGPLFHQLTAATDNGVHILDRRTVKEVIHLHGGQGAVRSLAFSFDQGLLATGGADTTVILWDMLPIMARATAAGEDAILKDQPLLWNDLGSIDALRGLIALRALKPPRRRKPSISSKSDS